MEIGQIMRKRQDSLPLKKQSSNDKNTLEQKTSRLTLFLDFWVTLVRMFIILVKNNFLQRTELIKTNHHEDELHSNLIDQIRNRMN